MIRSQRLNLQVIEAEIFEKVVRIKSCQTLRKWSAESGAQYGDSWTKDESRIADLVCIAYAKKIKTSVHAIVRCIQEETGEALDPEQVTKVIKKMDKTDEKLLKEGPLYLSETEYQMLKQYQKPSR